MDVTLVSTSPNAEAVEWTAPSVTILTVGGVCVFTRPGRDDADLRIYVNGKHVSVTVSDLYPGEVIGVTVSQRLPGVPDIYDRPRDEAPAAGQVYGKCPDCGIYAWTDDAEAPCGFCALDASDIDEPEAVPA